MRKVLFINAIRRVMVRSSWAGRVDLGWEGWTVGEFEAVGKGRYSGQEHSAPAVRGVQES